MTKTVAIVGKSQRAGRGDRNITDGGSRYE